MSSRFKLFVFIFSLFCVPIFSQAQTRSIISNLANPAIGMSALFLGQYAPNETTSGANGPSFQEAEISVISTVDPLWTLAGNFTFNASTGVAEEAYAITDSIPSIQFKVGEFRAAFGKHGTLHTHAFPFIQAQIIMSNTIGEEGFKNAGMEAAWMTPLPWYCELIAGGYAPISNDATGAANHPLNFNAPSQSNIPYLVHLKNLFDVDDDTTMELGASDLTGMGDDGLHHAVYGADFTLRNVPLRRSNQAGWILQAEYLKKVSYNASVYNQETDGWYASLQERLGQEWWTGFRVEEAFNTVPDVTVNPTDTYLAGHVQRASVNIAWLPSEFSEMKLEYGVARNDSNQLDNRVMLQFNYIIGFHPPHAY